MFREIMLGDFGGIEKSDWVQMWAGVFGAVPAAVISAAVAAGVAVMVLSRSTEHQRELADEAARKQQDIADRLATEQRELAHKQESEQRNQARDALHAQRAQAATQMAEQRSLAMLQLAEQRAEAARVREQAAIAETVIAAEDFRTASRIGVDAVSEQLPIMKSAVTRWRVELGGGAMAAELQYWPDLVFAAATVTIFENMAARRAGEEPGSLLIDAVASFTSAAMDWPSADEEGKERLTARLVEYRTLLRKAVTEADDSLGLR